MIQTYDDVRSGVQKRTSLKSLDHVFLKNIEQNVNCPPFISNAILEGAKRIYNLGNYNGENEAIKPGQLKVIGTLSSEPAGKPLKDCKTGVCIVTFNTGQEIDSKSYNPRGLGIQDGEGIFRGGSRTEGLQGLSVAA